MRDLEQARLHLADRLAPGRRSRSSTKSSSIAESGISTLCSTAIARARASIDARIAADVIDGLQTGIHGDAATNGQGRPW